VKTLVPDMVPSLADVDGVQGKLPLRTDSGTLNCVSRRPAQISASRWKFKPTGIFSALSGRCGDEALAHVGSLAQPSVDP
jgi:hypothetical protein